MTCPDCDRETTRLRNRIHQVQHNADRRNAELQRRVAYYEAIGVRVNSLIDHIGNHEIDDRGTHTWSYPHPGSVYGFWLAFQMALDKEPLSLSPSASSPSPAPPEADPLSAPIEADTQLPRRSRT